MLALNINNYLFAMSDTTKVTLSDGQLAMAGDKNIILTKRAVIDTSAALFSSLIPAINESFCDTILQNQKLSSSLPKITKGENYNSFPYVILDYPAVFEKENIFAIRTMFWWGNFISITLHISGKYKKHFEENIFTRIKEEEDFFVCVAENEWYHHFKESNYKKVSEINEAEMNFIQQKDFIKVALKYELHHWNMMQLILPEGYKKINKLLIS
jgi:hypothetical protein